MATETSTIVQMNRTPGRWVYDQRDDAHGIYSETGAMLGEMWRGIDAKFVATAADRIEALEAAVRDARGYAALALDRPTLHNRNTLKSIIEALDRAALTPKP